MDETRTTGTTATVARAAAQRPTPGGAAMAGAARTLAKAVFVIVLLAALVSLTTCAQPEKAHAAPSALDASWSELKPKLDAGLGVPYVFGGDTPIGWDCSGYASYTFNHHFGADYIHYTTSFEAQLRAQGCYVTTLTSSNLRDAAVEPGDVLFLYTEGVAEPTHMGIAGERVGGCIVVYHAFTNSMSAEGYAGTFRQGLDADVTGAGNTLWGSHSGHGKGSWSHITIYRGVQSTGGINLAKHSANASITDGNGCYSLKDAVYGVYASEADARAADFATRAWFTQTTGQVNADGSQADDWWTTDMDIPAGAYWVREISPPAGYALDATVYSVVVEPGASARVSAGAEAVFDAPQHNPLGLLVSKIDHETSASAPQGSASLAGALFTVRHYDGYYATVAEAEASGAATRAWVMATDEHGEIHLDDNHRAGGDALYRSLDGNPTLPLGTYLVQETAAPEGYLPDATTHVRQVAGEGPNELVSSYSAPLQPEQVMRGGVALEKRDAESELLTPLGAASIDGALFEVTTTSPNPVIVDGMLHAPGSVVATLEIEGGKAATAATALPYGTYELREVAAGDGYLLDGGEPRAFAITSDGQTIRFEGDASWFNQVKRGDLEFIKVREDGMARLAGVPFLLTSETTGERHVVVTDANGRLDTSSAWNRHAQRTNANDAAAAKTAEGRLADESCLDDEAGTWFGRTSEGGLVAADDELGALPFDTYTLEELRCTANQTLDLVAIRGIVVKRDRVTVDLGTIDDRTTSDPYLFTTASDGLDGDRAVLADPRAVVIDHVELLGLESGEGYVLRGALVRKDTGETVLDNGDAVTAEKAFVAEATNGSVEMRFEFDALSCAGGEVVALERLYESDGTTLLARHEDLEDTQQTVRIIAPTIKTLARDGSSGGRAVVCDPEAIVVDTVAYRNLVPGEEYELHGAIVVKSVGADGTAAVNPLMDGDAPVTSTTTFIPDESSGTLELTFAFDCASAPAPPGSQLVVFETLRRLDSDVAVHADPADGAQTVTVIAPQIATRATDGLDGDKQVIAEARASVVDAVSYEQLAVGKPYVLRGALMDAATGKPLVDDVGRPVTAQEEFTPEKPSGTVHLVFSFDASRLADASVVAFEILEREGVQVAAHADLSDEAQTVRVVAPPTESRAPAAKTGDEAGVPLALGVLLATGVCAAITAGARARARHQAGAAAAPRSLG